MNIELLQQIKAHILAEPDAFRMDTWSCGTAHCIAGWALTLTNQPIVNAGESPWQQTAPDGRTVSDAAGELLDLSDEYDGDDDEAYGDSTERARLFHVEHWPDSFIDDFDDAETRAEKARVAAARIDHFIATGGTE